jgi:hypothetical protein
MPLDPHLVNKPGSQRGIVQAIADLNRRVNKLMARSQLSQGSITHDVIATGTITAAEISAGVITALLISGDVITAGGPSPASRVVLDSSGIKSYNGTTLNMNIASSDGSVTTNGSLTVAGTTTLGGTLTVSGTATVSGTIQTNAAGSRGVKITSGGITGYDNSGASKFIIDGTTGLITCTGVITATGGAVPTGIVTGSMPGSANRYSNSAFQDGSSAFDTTGWQITATPSDGGTTVPPIYGTHTVKCVAPSTGSFYVWRNSGPVDAQRVVPGVNYTFSHYVWPVTNGRTSSIDVRWYNSSGTQIGTDAIGVSVANIADQWNRITQTQAAPAGAAYALGIHRFAATSGDVWYTHAYQMEEGDRASAWAPRPDEIVTGSTITTATSGARVQMTGSPNELAVFDSSSKRLTLDGTNGMTLSATAASTDIPQALTWHKGTTSGSKIATIQSYYFAPDTNFFIGVYDDLGHATTTEGAGFQMGAGRLAVDGGSDVQQAVEAWAYQAGRSVNHYRIIIQGDGQSSFLQVPESTTSLRSLTLWGHYTVSGTTYTLAAGNSGGITSITRNGVGDVTINFSTSFANTGYGFTVNCLGGYAKLAGGGMNTGSVRILLENPAGTAADLGFSFNAMGVF